ncbi:IclR family transcriptional regulator [Bergeriella denitrificans]|uniref:Acetate operon repressor n=1 Tax=Bergeriella denitrificans TaxID=494 RepID=A0A378UGS9_BERDE|nr:IclR family transcriptional regulator [Bergeriella denitrificans]STZ76584.1 Acetate operon repressor [Bergeriella denitrificans]
MNAHERGSSITRVLQIIEAVASAERPPAPQDLVQQLGIPKPSLHRLLQLLEQEQFIQTDVNHTLVPGIRSMRLSVHLWHNKYYKADREAVLADLSRKIGETCGITVPNGHFMSYTDRVQTNWPLQIYLPTGTQVPLHCTAGGKLYLSHLSAEKRKRLVAHLPLEQLTHNTHIRAEDFLAELKTVEAKAYGWDNQEFIAGMVGCAVPIYDKAGNFLAGLYTHAPVIRKNLDDLLHYLPDMQEAAEEISRIIDL